MVSGLFEHAAEERRRTVSILGMNFDVMSRKVCMRSMQRNLEFGNNSTWSMIGLTGMSRSKWAVAVSRRRIWFAGISQAFKQTNHSVSRSVTFLEC